MFHSAWLIIESISLSYNSDRIAILYNFDDWYFVYTAFSLAVGAFRTTVAIFLAIGLKCSAVYRE